MNGKFGYEKSYWYTVWEQYRTHPIGVFSLCILSIFGLVGIYAPFLASSKPLIVIYDGTWYFPLFRYLFYLGFYTKYIDLFFNLLMFTFPGMLISLFLKKPYGYYFGMGFVFIQLLGFILLMMFPISDPSSDVTLTKKRIEWVRENQTGLPWETELKFMNSYAKLNLLLENRLIKNLHDRLTPYEEAYKQESGNAPFPSLWQREQKHLQEIVSSLQKDNSLEALEAFEAKNRLQAIQEKKEWIEGENQKISLVVMPLVRPLHWEDDAGGNQTLNRVISSWELTRINRKDLTAALIFGIRVSMVVGIVSIFLALAIGVPIGALAGYYGGKFDIFMSRLVEIWESMPVLFMLLLIVAIIQSKSIFLIITVIGIFGWTGFCRFTRGEFFKQRNLPYIEACRAIGFPNQKIMFNHILPNAIPPLLTLMPFAIMGAISSEAALSFLGLGEAGSCSWGVLMDEGRKAFPGENYLLWPPAILLTVLLISIAIVGDTLRDALDPKLHVFHIPESEAEIGEPTRNSTAFPSKV